MRLVRTAAVFAALAVAAPAYADNCPLSQQGIEGNLTGPPENSKVSVDLVESVAIGAVKGLSGTVVLRRVTIAPGGIIRLHDHTTNPGYAQLVSGKALEHRSDCGAPIRRLPGDVATEHTALTHWWVNDGDEPAVLMVSHVLVDGK